MDTSVDETPSSALVLLLPLLDWPLAAALPELELLTCAASTFAVGLASPAGALVGAGSLA